MFVIKLWQFWSLAEKSGTFSLWNNAGQCGIARVHAAPSRVHYGTSISTRTQEYRDLRPCYSLYI
jgi:hypothetical protein